MLVRLSKTFKRPASDSQPKRLGSMESCLEQSFLIICATSYGVHKDFNLANINTDASEIK